MFIDNIYGCLQFAPRVHGDDYYYGLWLWHRLDLVSVRTLCVVYHSYTAIEQTLIRNRRWHTQPIISARTGDSVIQSTTAFLLEIAVKPERSVRPVFSI